MNSTKTLSSEPTEPTQGASGSSVSASPNTLVNNKWLEKFKGIHGNSHSGSPLCAEPTELTEGSRGQETIHGLTMAELSELAGKDWPDLEANPALLECFAEIVSIRKMRERGEVPPTYTAVTVCRHCGPVPIFPGVAEKVEGCPWCMNRAAGRPMPKGGDHGHAA